MEPNVSSYRSKQREEVTGTSDYADPQTAELPSCLAAKMCLPSVFLQYTMLDKEGKSVSLLFNETALEAPQICHTVMLRCQVRESALHRLASPEMDTMFIVYMLDITCDGSIWNTQAPRQPCSPGTLFYSPLSMNEDHVSKSLLSW